MQHKTGYTVWQHGEQHWHRTLSRAIERAQEFWARDFAQVIDCATGDTVWGNAQ